MSHKSQYEGILRRTSFYESEQGNARGRVMLNLFQHLILFHWAKPLVMFFALIIGGLCFGQGVWIKDYPKIALPEPITISPTLVYSEMGIRKVSYSSAINASGYLNPNILMMQVEAETLQPKTSFWKQTRIYGLEFLGASVGSGIPSILGLAMVLYNTIDNPGDPSQGYEIYIIGNTLLSSTSSWFVGKLCNQDNSWWKSAIGAALGSGIGVFMLDKWIKKEEKGSFYPEGIFFFSLPPLCATIGLNL